MSILDFKSKLKKKLTNNTFFATHFGFESGIDIADDNQVLYRKNVVIKNIIFITNLIYTLMFTILSIGEPSNWLLTVLLFPVTFCVNYMLNKMINKGPNDRISQNIAMYFASFYMFLSTVLIYFKLKNGSADFLKECGYILIYYSLTISAFYQDKKMLKNIYIWVLICVTILHFTVTYAILNEATNMTVLQFFKENSDALKDIFIRTILLCLFMLLLYIYVSMANYMQEERKKELIKRRKVQEDYTNVVSKIFDVTLSDLKYSDEEKHNIEIISVMVKKLASLLNYEPNKCEEIANYAKIQLNNNVNLDKNNYSNDDDKFESLRKQTELGSTLISRLQLERKCEDIIRATFEEANDDDFIKRMIEIQNSKESQIVLICDLYTSMRSFKSYKKAYNHKVTMNYMEQHFKIYFDAIIFDRFIRFSNEFETIFDEL